MADTETLVERAQQRIEAERDEALKNVKMKFATFNRITDEQFLRLYKMFIRHGHPDDYLQSDKTKIIFLEWATTTPLKVVKNDDQS